MTPTQPFLIYPFPPILSKPVYLDYTSPRWYAHLYELAQNHPHEALEHLDKLHHPESCNLKAYVLLKMKQLALAEKVIEENFIKYPANISVKINYADLCLRKKQWKVIRQIFPSIDLSELYPDQTTFCASEFRGFMVLMGFYHLKLRKYKLSEQFYTLAVKADPLHPSVAFLEKKVFDFIVLKSLWNFFTRA